MRNEKLVMSNEEFLPRSTQRYTEFKTSFSLFLRVTPCSPWLSLLLLVLAPAFISAQTADEIESLLQEQAITYAQAARFALEASDAAAIADPTEAFQFAADRNWLPKKAAPEAEARLDHVALLLVQAFNVKGGFMYTMTKAPLYAYRELRYLNIIQGRSDPHMKVSGDNLLFIVNGLLAQRDGE